jgi:hypothetical protein
MTGWFEVEDEGLLPGAPGLLLQKLREREATWRELAVAAADTFAWYAGSRLHALVYLYDHEANVTIGCLRLELSDAGWQAGWVSSSLADHDEFEVTGPLDAITGQADAAGDSAGEAVDWLESQLRRPVVRRSWRDGGEVVARSWRLEDTGRGLVLSGPPERSADPATADEALRVR